MFPWLWQWSPQFHFPLSGSVAQRIDPDAFFGAIPPWAGNGRVEQQAFEEVASYGRQLGLITELLLDLAAQQPPVTAAGQEAQRRLGEIHARIEALKKGAAT